MIEHSSCMQSHCSACGSPLTADNRCNMEKIQRCRSCKDATVGSGKVPEDPDTLLWNDWPKAGDPAHHPERD